MNKHLKERINTITQVIGVSGHEVLMARTMKKYYQQYDVEILHDNLGSIYALKKSKVKNAPKVMIAGHLDEVGFMVKQIQENGLLKIVPIGGIWEQTLLAQRVRILTRDLKEVKGSICSIPPHFLTEADRKAPMKIENMLVDIGAENKKQVLDKGVQVGDTLVIDGAVNYLSKSRVVSKAWDNRYGCIVGLEVLEYFKDKELPFDLYVGANVQEEVGLRGAQTATQMINPDFAIVLDCSPAMDLTGDKNANGILGKGVLVRFYDRSYLPNRSAIEYYEKHLEKNNIPYQYFYSLGGTDAGAIHKVNDGVATLTLCICGRNLHTNSITIDLNDFNYAIKALTTLLETLTPKQIQLFKEGNR